MYQRVRYDLNKELGKIKGAGLFKEEIVPVSIPQRKSDPIVFDSDERPRRGTSVERLAKLRAAFQKEGSVTAGNASSVNDAGAAVLGSSIAASPRSTRLRAAFASSPIPSGGPWV